MDADKRATERLRALYDERAAAYAYRGADGFPARKHRGILAALEPLPRGRLLEVGCGQGPYVAWAARHGFPAVVGVDLSPLILLEAQKRVRGESDPERVHLVAADAAALPFRRGVFDVILCTQVIEHVPDEAAALDDMRRLATQDAWLVLSTDNRANRITQALLLPSTVLRRLLHRSAWHPPFPHRSYAMAEFCALARRAGWVVVRASTYRFSWPARLGRVPLLVRALDAVEGLLIRLPWFRAWGDILLLVARARNGEAARR